MGDVMQWLTAHSPMGNFVNIWCLSLECPLLGRNHDDLIFSGELLFFVTKIAWFLFFFLYHRPLSAVFHGKNSGVACYKENHVCNFGVYTGKPITVSCAYSGRMAVAYRRGDVQAQPNHPEEKFINLYVAIYECESTGWSQVCLQC